MLDKPKLSERDIERTIREYLEWDGWRVFHFEQNFSERKRKVVGEPGMPDLLCIRYGRDGDHVVWLELKAPTGKPRKAQMLWCAAERQRGATAFIAGRDFPATIEGFQQWYRASGLMRRKV
jgi:hypothetical protein